MLLLLAGGTYLECASVHGCMELGDRVQELEDQVEIRELKARYCAAVDSLDEDEWVSLFTESGRMTGGFEYQGSHDGHDAIRQRIRDLENEDRTFMQHTVFNPLIEIDGDDAHGTWYFDVMVMDDEDSARWIRGNYDETYRRVEGEWKYEVMHVNITFRVDYEDGSWAIVPVSA